MARPPKLKIEISSDGTHQGTRLVINGAIVKCYGIRFEGNKDAGYKIVLDLGQPDESKEIIG